MKTSLAIVLATIALTFGAMLSFTSGVEAHEKKKKTKKSPGAYHFQVPLPSPPGPPQALIAIVRLGDVPARLSLGRLVGIH